MKAPDSCAVEPTAPDATRPRRPHPGHGRVVHDEHAARRADLRQEAAARSGIDDGGRLERRPRQGYQLVALRSGEEVVQQENARVPRQRLAARRGKAISVEPTRCAGHAEHAPRCQPRASASSLGAGEPRAPPFPPRSQLCVAARAPPHGSARRRVAVCSGPPAWRPLTAQRVKETHAALSSTDAQTTTPKTSATVLLERRVGARVPLPPRSDRILASTHQNHDGYRGGRGREV